MSNENMMKSLRDRAKEMTSRLPFMDGRDKGVTDDLIGSVITIRDFGFLTDRDKSGNEKEYVVFIVDGIPKKFFFGGMVLTDQLRTLESEGYGDEIRAEGLPTLLTTKRAKSGMSYTNVEFYPE